MAASGSTSPPAVLEELFRSFHSLKGISAMVELREAELLAHHMESCLRAIRQGASASMPPPLRDAGGRRQRVTGGVIVARRAGAIRRLREARDRRRARRLAAPPADPRHREIGVHQARMDGRVTFVPSPALVERGVKVDTVRARLLQVGEVLSVTPNGPGQWGASRSSSTCRPMTRRRWRPVA